MSWDSVPADQQNGPIIYYIITVVVEQTRSSYTLNVTSTSTTLPNLHPSYNYSIQVAAATAVHTGPFSRAIAIKTPDDG